MRTITQLINPQKHVYVVLETDKLCRKFLERAELEGFMFGDTPPSEKEFVDIVAILENKQLCYVGIVGRLGIQSKSPDIIVIDYAKYLKDKPRYIWKG